jgi:lipid II:glycine glycyltransferase (peptidoglycan interpeptide bridge formation enzyme)
MVIKEITEKSVWEKFFLGEKEKTFLQSWNWGEFQKKEGNAIWRLGIYDDNKIVFTVLVVKVVARRGTFLLVQHLLEADKEVLKILLEELKKIGKEEKVDFIRIAPLWLETVENEKIFNDLGLKKSPMHANAYEATWQLNILPSEEELMKNMRKTTRYLIRQAQKNSDIKIEKSFDKKDLQTYQRLNREVARRQKFVPFSDKFIENEFEVFSEDNEVLCFFGKHKNETAAAALVIFWSGIGFYHQAASLSKYAKFSIPYLLQWEVIKEAKSRGCEVYDFWGYTDPKKYPKHPWAGPTLFKMGFGGQAKEYIKTQDFPLSRKYKFICFFENLRKIKRGF